MHLKWWIFLINLYISTTTCDQQLTILSKTHSTHLEKFYGYIDILLLHFKVPENTRFVSFKFQAEENALSLFGCKPKDVSVYLKAGGPPVINPDGSALPKHFLTEGRPDTYILNFTSNSSCNYINITAPTAGSYFAAAFKSYSDPKLDGITQSGLTPDCLTLLNAGLYASRRPLTYMIVPHKPVHVILVENTDRLFKFHTPEATDSAFLTISHFYFCDTCEQLFIRIKDATIPTDKDYLYELRLLREDYTNASFHYRFMVQETCWYYIDYMYANAVENVTLNDTGEFIFQIDYFSSFINVADDNQIRVKTELIVDNKINTKYKPNDAFLYKHGAMRNYESNYSDYNVPYKQYNLVREGNSESFMYSFDLHPDPDGIVPLTLNITNEDVTVLKFHINTGLDVGGTLQFGLSFKPVLKTRGQLRWYEDETSNHTIIGCLRNGAKEIPIWPDKCVYNNALNSAVIKLNSTTDNNTVYVPYPEPGDWYASFKLFCDSCLPCNCSSSCKDAYKNCSVECESACYDMQSCNMCVDNCEQEIIDREDCSGCDCDGPCQREKTVCNSSIIFIVESFPCVGGKCGRNGKCVFVISEGLAYSLCVCTNNYRGWDCSDGSQANTYSMIVLELLLLVLSNLMFLPAVYVALKRKYYVEAITYFSTCFFSTFYHACDAGENIISFCLVRLSVLQFSDFFCGLLSIWVTLIAVAYLRKPWPSLCHITGAILLAFGTSINKTSLWVFVVPFISGIIIVAISWFFNYKKGGVVFPTRRYLFIVLPVGVIVAGVGLLMYALLQTHSNYKYIHSLWHILMATVIIILLPNISVFAPVPITNNSD